MAEKFYFNMTNSVIAVFLFLSFSLSFGMSEIHKTDYLKQHSPNVPHEALPSGVISSANYSRQATVPNFNRLPSEKFVNPWGQIYQVAGDSIPNDAYVEVAWISLWAFKISTMTWERLVHSTNIGGGSWVNDFKSTCAKAPDFRLEADHNWSMKSLMPSCNVHFWPVARNAWLLPDSVAAFLIVSPMRVAIIDSSKRANLIASVGADWKEEHGKCATPQGRTVPICIGIGTGPFQRIETKWKLIGYYAEKIKTYVNIPLPPDSAFTLPEN